MKLQLLAGLSPKPLSISQRNTAPFMKIKTQINVNKDILLKLTNRERTWKCVKGLTKHTFIKWYHQERHSRDFHVWMSICQAETLWYFQSKRLYKANTINISAFHILGYWGLEVDNLVKAMQIVTVWTWMHDLKYYAIQSYPQSSVSAFTKSLKSWNQALLLKIS